MPTMLLIERAARHQVLPLRTLWTALKDDESLCNPRMAEGFAEFEAACEVKDLSLRSDPAKPRLHCEDRVNDYYRTHQVCS